jgi:hypothetical protein
LKNSCLARQVRLLCRGDSSSQDDDFFLSLFFWQDNSDISDCTVVLKSLNFCSGFNVLNT